MEAKIPTQNSTTTTRNIQRAFIIFFIIAFCYEIISLLSCKDSYYSENVQISIQIKVIEKQKITNSLHGSPKKCGLIVTIKSTNYNWHFAVR